MDLLSRPTALTPRVGARARTDGGAQAGERGTVAVATEQLHVGALLNGMGTPVFVLDTDGRVIVWNDPIATLMSVSATEALGSKHVSELFYPDGRRAKTLADRVLDDPRNVNVVNGLDVADEAGRLYRDTNTMMDRHGAERHTVFTAQSLFEGDELVGVVETVRDWADAVEGQRASEAFVGEVSTTVGGPIAGNLSARASFTDNRGVLKDETLAVASDLNEVVTRSDRLANEVNTMATDLGGAIQWAVTIATDIESQVTKQADLLLTGAEEMQELSANMEEIAAISDEAAPTVNQACVAVEDDHEIGQNTRSVIDQAIDIFDELLNSATELQQHMVIIEEVVEVITEVADRINLLMLNASIEAVHAGEAGEGFPIVVDEIEQPTNQTHECTEKIADSIIEIQEQVDETILASEQSHRQIQVASGEIEDVLVSPSEIAGTADSAANGITEVARVAGSQTTNIGEIMNAIQMAQGHAAAAEVSMTDITDAMADQTVALDVLTNQMGAFVGGDTAAVEELDATDFGDAAGSVDTDTDTDSARAATDGRSDDEFGGFQFDR